MLAWSAECISECIMYWSNPVFRTTESKHVNTVEQQDKFINLMCIFKKSLNWWWVIWNLPKIYRWTRLFFLYFKSLLLEMYMYTFKKSPPMSNWYFSMQILKNQYGLFDLQFFLYLCFIKFIKTKMLICIYL